MRLTIRRVKLNAQGYDRRGRYYGAGERLYYCPEVDDKREEVSCYFREDPFIRTNDLRFARECFKARMERMSKPGHAKGAWV